MKHDFSGNPLAESPRTASCVGCSDAILDHARGADVGFFGRRLLPRGASLATLRTVLASTGSAHRVESVVENRQCHGNRLVVARVGRRAEADGMITEDPTVALCVYTADCVPVLLAAEERRAAAHAGWRGLANGTLARAVEALATDPARTTAWIGPCMGGCCYEVGWEVAAAVVASCGSGVVVERDGARPGLDLGRAAAQQLQGSGVEDVRWLRHCTGCAPDLWWSHRRSGPGAGRNYAVIWQSGSASALRSRSSR